MAGEERSEQCVLVRNSMTGAPPSWAGGSQERCSDELRALPYRHTSCCGGLGGTGAVETRSGSEKSLSPLALLQQTRM
jgi:hypothetical protein